MIELGLVGLVVLNCYLRDIEGLPMHDYRQVRSMNKDEKFSRVITRAFNNTVCSMTVPQVAMECNRT
jgi:hypothetical protein